jgi:hypothetical protein
MALVLTVGVGAVAAAGPHGPSGAATAARGTEARAGGADRTAMSGRLPLGTLTDDQASLLAGMAEEEKLVRDLYEAFAGRYPSPVFDTIGAAESSHLAAIRALLARYGIADPTAGMAEGAFASPDVAKLYASLLAQGSASESAAFAVGRLVENDDIAKLDAARSGVTAPDVLRVYSNLRRGSTRHLAAFSNLHVGVQPAANGRLSWHIAGRR